MAHRIAPFATTLSGLRVILLLPAFLNAIFRTTVQP